MARVVAEKAGLVFLVAYVVARNLCAADVPVDVSNTAWQAHIATDVGAAFNQYLDRFDQDAKSELSTASVIDLLRPLAFTEGSGLPCGGTTPLWAALASAMAGKEYVDGDVTALLKHAGAYIVEATEHGRSVSTPAAAA